MSVFDDAARHTRRLKLLLGSNSAGVALSADIWRPLAVRIVNIGPVSADWQHIALSWNGNGTRLFQNNCKSDDALDVNIVQQLCYDVGVYYSLLDIRISIKPFVHNTQNIMTDDSFLVWWRSNSEFR